jgi:hypothetical protein
MTASLPRTRIAFNHVTSTGANTPCQDPFKIEARGLPPHCGENVMETTEVWSPANRKTVPWVLRQFAVSPTDEGESHCVIPRRARKQ